MSVAIEVIKQLREETGAGILTCREALEQTGGDLGRAAGYLREKNLVQAAKTADRQAYQGRLELYSHGGGRIGVMVEINTETDFAARSEAFRSFAHEIALQIAAAAPEYVRDEDIPAAVLEVEAREAADKARREGKPERLVERIVEGYLKKFRDEKVLLRQTYIRDETVSVAQLLNQVRAAVSENVVIRRFARWELTEVPEEAQV